jgi:cation:H+ antiporter
MFSAIAVAVGLGLLVKGADWLVSGASGVASRFGISPLVIGLTVVAFGTSAPELSVNLLAAFDGNDAIAVGNIVGSNIANVLLILGIAAILAPMRVQRTTVWKEIPMSLLAAAVLFAFGADVFLDGAPTNVLSRAEALSLIGFFVIFLYYTFGIARTGQDADSAESPAFSPRAPWRLALLIVAGLALLIVGGGLVVDGATAIAAALGIPERIIALTLVAVGTSLPELATSVVAALRGEADIAVGNVVGSNIFNIFWILGVTGLIRPLSFPAGSSFDLAVLVATSLILFLALFVGRRHSLCRGEGVTFLLLYAAYVTHLALA